MHLFKKVKIASNKHIESSAPQERLPASPLGSGQSSDQLALGCLKNKPLSTQKALMSTLAFAAKIESLMKMNQSTSGALAVSSMFDCVILHPKCFQHDLAGANRIAVESLWRSTHSNEWAGNKLDGFSGWHHSLCFAALASVWRRTGACEIVSQLMSLKSKENVNG
ncbi:hypothetical protein OIU84_010672 [Salix udensis]|uniref:Uncharacterized protein n=1 Tax=Salix udensis TaxID=889485 RepID=A0AAD6JLK5_9ROSI|nr:hypothetical protein OIU84_010672 [Salix udensis]